MNAVSLPDEVFLALSRFLGLNVGEASTPQHCEEEPCRPRLYPISDDDSDDPCFSFHRLPMRRNFEEDARYRSSPNGPTSRQNGPPEAPGRLSPCCSKNKDYPDCNSPQCTTSAPFHQEDPPVYRGQGQGLLQEVMQKRFYQQQSPLNRTQLCPHSGPRSQSLPRGNKNSDCHRAQHTEQELLSPQRGRCELRTPCEGETPARNSCLSNCSERYISERSCRNNASSNWNNSSQVGSNYGEWQRRQMQMQHQQPQQQCQSQAHNQSNRNWLEDDEISRFEPDLNSTMIDEDKRSCQQRQLSSFNKPCNSQSQSQRSCRAAEEMSRRQSKCEAQQMSCRQSQCESQRCEPQQYETLLNQTSYMQLPEAPKNAKCSQNQCSNSQAMHQDISFMNQTKPCHQGPRSRSSSPLNCSSFRNQGATSCENNMHNTTPYSEDTNCSRSPTYMEMSRAMLGRSFQNETNRNSTFGGRSARMHAKTPEELLADRTQAEFFDALVKDRTCPGAIQASLNGSDNFIEFAFDIAFTGSVPDKPFPVDPITMVEAIKLRIDYERDEIRKRVREHERDQPKDQQHRVPTTEDIESYFEDNSKSDVNVGVAAFLKAESQYRLTNMEAGSAFVAQMKGLDTNMFDDQIKLNAYSATTRPVQPQ